MTSCSHAASFLSHELSCDSFVDFPALINVPLTAVHRVRAGLLLSEAAVY